MLTRLKVSGFKNLVDIDIRFGAFTCLAGANGVGKSNLFDAIRFLSALSDGSLLEAARSVRDNTRPDVRMLFQSVGDWRADRMSFVAEMLVPRRTEDDFGVAEASTTFLRYEIELGYREDDGGLEIRREELKHITRGDAAKNLLFPHSVAWRESVVTGRLTSALISTIGDPDSADGVQIQLHQNAGGKGGGRPMPVSARSLKRTLINQANSSEHKTTVVARNEMRSWIQLQLEPASLRESDSVDASSRLGRRGEHLAATLYRIGRQDSVALERIARRVRNLVEDIWEIGVERDDKRDLLTLWVQGRDSVVHPARSLSEGTLRFLALATLEEDSTFLGVICLEEPENGIHPERIPKIVQLLRAIAVDPDEPVDDDNPLRQVIVNTHSPLVMRSIGPDDLVIAGLTSARLPNRYPYQKLVLESPSNTWRAMTQALALREPSPK